MNRYAYVLDALAAVAPGYATFALVILALGAVAGFIWLIVRSVWMVKL